MLDVWKFCLRGVWCWSSSPAGTCQWLELAVRRQDMEQERGTWLLSGHPLLLLRASVGNPDTFCDIPGTQSHSSRCSLRHPAVLARRAASSLVSPLCSSLQEPCLTQTLGGSRSCRLGVSGGAVLTLCHFVNLIQCLTSAPNSSTEAV